MKKPKEIELVKMIQRFPKIKFIDTDLPSPSDYDPQVFLRREQLLKFRNSYCILLNFVSLICGVAPKELSPIHLMNKLGLLDIDEDLPTP